MAREIKFRAWLPEINRMGYAITIQELHRKVIDVDECDVDSFIWMQYTGLKDKNGVEIYEGDVLEITGNHKPGKYIVVWDDYRVAWWGRNIKCDKREREYEDDYFQLLGSWQKDITEIIGNVYQNPELLEV